MPISSAPQIGFISPSQEAGVFLRGHLLQGFHSSSPNITTLCLSPIFYIFLSEKTQLPKTSSYTTISDFLDKAQDWEVASPAA